MFQQCRFGMRVESFIHHNPSAEIQSINTLETLQKGVVLHNGSCKITNVKRSFFSSRRTLAAVLCLVQTSMVSLPASWNKWLPVSKCTALAYPRSSKTTPNNISVCPQFHCTLRFEWSKCWNLHLAQSRPLLHRQNACKFHFFPPASGFEEKSAHKIHGHGHDKLCVVVWQNCKWKNDSQWL